MSRVGVIPTQQRLMELLVYNPETGLFTHRIRRRGVTAGAVAGAIDGKGYVQIGVDRGLYRAHRLAWLYMTGAWPSDEIDHKDRDRTNNRWDNLRAATGAQNKLNSKQRNKTGMKGVFMRDGRYCARIYLGSGKWKYLGAFNSLDEASSAYREAAKTTHGEFAVAA